MLCICSFQHILYGATAHHAAVLESQAFGEYDARRDSQARPSGDKSDTPGQIGGSQLDAATPAGHAMQQATHSEIAAPLPAGDGQDLKAVVTEWMDKTFLPAINAQVCDWHASLQQTCQFLY